MHTDDRHAYTQKREGGGKWGLMANAGNGMPDDEMTLWLLSFQILSIRCQSSTLTANLLVGKFVEVVI